MTRPAKLTKEQQQYILTNPDRLSNKELSQRFKVSAPTIIAVRYKRGAYAESV